MDSVTLEKLEFDKVREILARFCRTGLGVSLARKIGPSRDLRRIRTWLAQTSEMVDTLVETGVPPFAGVTDISAALDRATPGGAATGEDFAAVASTLRGAAAVKGWAGGLEDSAPLLAALGLRLGDFAPEVEAIDKIVDARGEIKDTASDRLLSIRRELEGCRRQIREVVYSFVRRGDVAQHLQSTTVQMHGDRYVLPVKADHRGRLPGVIHRASHTGATLFIEPAECVQLNNHLVRLQEKETDEITRLLGELAIRIHRRADDIRASLRTLAQLDLIAAKAQYAYQFNMTRPDVAADVEIQFHQGRHPLLIEQAYQQELAGVGADERHEVVPIDVRLGSDFNLLILTGSNTGGKTVTLKTVGLMVLMAHSGMHLPVRRGATIRLLNDVLLDVGDEQSLQQSLSTFGGHLKRIRQILRRADKRTLVLLDELGSGTDPEEGGAFGQALLDELLRVECLGMITTHLGVLKAYAYTHDGVDNASVEFDTETLRPTYKLLIGQPGESHALVVAEHYGLPKRLIRRARHHLPRAGKQLRKAIRATAASRQASEAARAEAATAKLEAQQHQELYESKLSRLEQTADQFSDWLASLPAMRPGDQVYVRRFGAYGRLIRMLLSKQAALVDVDGKEVEIPLTDMMPQFGPADAAEKITTLRQQIAAEHRRAEAVSAQADEALAEARRRVKELGRRQQHVDAWLEAIGSLTVGDEATFARRPGRGRIAALDWPAGKAVVEIDRDGESERLELRLQELFPERGAFGGAAGGDEKARRKTKSPKKADRPIAHRKPGTKRARSNRRVLLSLPAGAEVYAAPFRKRARLVRIDEAKDVAVVQSGAFEMQLPLADVEPIGHAGQAGGRGKKRGGDKAAEKKPTTPPPSSEA